jgi:hypothetical protein
VASTCSGPGPERGFIGDPKKKNKSVIFTEEGLALARASAERLEFFCLKNLGRLANEVIRVI